MFVVMGLIAQVALWQLGSAEFTARAGGSLSSWVDSGKAKPRVQPVPAGRRKQSYFKYRARLLRAI